ncbi:DedA family protein DedA [Gammaproteobacteria bacterium]
MILCRFDNIDCIRLLTNANMEFIEFILHAEIYLREFLVNHGHWIYLVLFLIIFAETGLVVMPFLPGDSLLFTIGLMAAEGLLNIKILLITLLIAAIVGDTVNYWIGRWIGPRAFNYQNSRWLRKEYLERAESFYEKYGGKAIVLARFVPIVRTFAPFVAGIGSMNYSRFIFFNISGALAWIGLFLFGGYYLGNLPGVKNNMKMIIILIVVISILPIIIEWLKTKKSTDQG